MKPETHLAVDPSLCGRVVELGGGTAEVALDTTAQMAVDDHGLVHGGFVFGLADYAAMLAVNDPCVVLAGAEVRFLEPVVVGSRIIGRARTTSVKGRKHEVSVEARVGNQLVFDGTFICIVLERHVLDAAGSE